MSLTSSLIAPAVISWLSCALFVSVAFEITVPQEPQVAIFGHSMVLLCSFPVGGSSDSNTIIVTWQRDLEVIHSFYYGQDQLAMQSPHYANRTALYHSELLKGNASLRLDRVTLKDSGNYTCSISTHMGSQKKTFPLTFAAFYTEPHLQVNMFHREVQLLLISQGYPEPSLQWLDDNGQDVTNETVMTIKKDDRGLYVVSSSLAQEGRANKTLTFVLRNTMLNQEVRRELALYSGPEDTSQHCQWARPAVYVLVLVGAILVALLVILLTKSYSSKLKTCLPTQKGHVDNRTMGTNPEQTPLQDHV